MSENEAFLSRILIFPIKSLAAVELAQARMLSCGALEHDRTWGLFDAGGKFVNGKRQAAVHRLRARVDLEAGSVTLRDENGRGLGERTFSLDRDGDLLESWFAEYFGFPVSFGKNVALGFPDDTASPGPTLISVATLAEIGRWFDLPIEEVRARFRTNIEIGGVPAFWEDRLFGPAGTVVRFRIGDAVLEGVNPCQRCIVPPRGSLDRRARRHVRPPLHRAPQSYASFLGDARALQSLLSRGGQYPPAWRTKRQIAARRRPDRNPRFRLCLTSRARLSTACRSGRSRRPAHGGPVPHDAPAAISRIFPTNRLSAKHRFAEEGAYLRHLPAEDAVCGTLSAWALSCPSAQHLRTR